MLPAPLLLVGKAGFCLVKKLTKQAAKQASKRPKSPAPITSTFLTQSALLLAGMATGLCRTYTTTLFKKLNEVPRWPMATGGRRYCLHLAQSDKPIVAIPAMATGGRCTELTL